MSDNPLSAWWMNALNSLGNAFQPQRPNPLASLIASNPVGTSVVAPQLTNATPIDTRTPVQRQLADAAPMASMMVLGMAGESPIKAGDVPQWDWTPGGGSKTMQIGNTELTYGIGRDGKTGELILIKTPQAQRGQGSGRNAMQSFVDQADQNGTTLFLNSDPMDKGISKPKLDKFYKSFGFVKNMGKNKDFSSRAEFVRQPQSDGT